MDNGTGGEGWNCGRKRTHKFMTQEDCGNVLVKLLSSLWHTEDSEITRQYHGERDCQSLKLSHIIMRHCSGVQVPVDQLASELRAPVINYMVCFRHETKLCNIYSVLDDFITAPLKIKMPMSHADMALCRDFVYDAMWVFSPSAVWKLKTDGRYEMRKERRCWAQVISDLENGVYKTSEDFFMDVHAMAESHLKIHAYGSAAYTYASHLMDLCGMSCMYRTMFEWRASDWDAHYVSEDDEVSFTERFHDDYPEADAEWYKKKRNGVIRFISVHYRACLMDEPDGPDMSCGYGYKRAKT